MFALNLVRVFLCGAWTAIVGAPLVVVICVRYAYGLAQAKLGHVDVLDRVLDANARLTGWVAQRLWTTVLLAIVGIRLRIRELIPVDWTQTYVICANHASVFDILALIRAVPPPYRFVAKRELLKWPFVGWALRPAGQIVIDRADHARALRNIAEAAVRKVRGQVVFFVEGTRSRTGELLPFKKGAFQFAIDNHLPVLPTAIRGSYAALAKLPWWKVQPGREIEILICRALESITGAGGLKDGPAPAVEALRTETHTRIAAALANGA